MMVAYPRTLWNEVRQEKNLSFNNSRHLLKDSYTFIFFTMTNFPKFENDIFNKTPSLWIKSSITPLSYPGYTWGGLFAPSLHDETGHVSWNVSQPGGADGSHTGPVELRILGELLSPSGDVLPVLPECLRRHSSSCQGQRKTWRQNYLNICVEMKDPNLVSNSASLSNLRRSWVLSLARRPAPGMYTPASSSVSSSSWSSTPSPPWMLLFSWPQHHFPPP